MHAEDLERLLELKLLGTPTVFREGDPVQGFISIKSRALLFYLAMKPGVHSRQTLATLLWPEATETGAAKNLRNVLSNLRKLVGAHLDITRRTAAFRRDSAYSLDVEQYSALLERYRRDKEDTGLLEQAVLLYAGDFLEGFHVHDSEIFEAWLISEREQLRHAQLESLRILATLYTDLSDYNKGLDYVSRLLTLDNFSETGQRIKMAILAHKGQRNEALAQYAEFSSLLDEELGVAPTPETTRLYEQIKAGAQQAGAQQAGGYESGSTDAFAIKQPPSKQGAREQSQYIDWAQYVDWGDIPGEVPFYGRQEQLEQLQQWLTEKDSPGKVSRSEGRRFIAITGMGGVGKTALAARLTRWLAQQPQSHECIIWRSLINAPPLTAVLRLWLTTLSGQQLAEIPETVDEQMALLMTYLRQHRCLLILDNFESILETGVRAGRYRAGYEAYGQLIQRVGGGQHQSCLLITSRELPQELSRMSTKSAHSTVLNLPGLPDKAGAGMLRAHGIAGTDAKLSTLVQRYSGNPLALKLVADTAQTLFAGDIDTLMGETAVFGDIYDVLNEQFNRLTPLEDEILTWLAIEREPVTSQTIWDNLARQPHKRQFLEALRSLYFRSLLEQAPDTSKQDTESAPRYTLQNVIMEYATSHFIESVCQELEAGKISLLQQYTMQKAHTKEFVQASQRRLLLEPVAQWLVSRLGRAGAVEKVDGLLETVRAEPSPQPGYAGANILHLLTALDEALNGRDFSHLAIWQADLRDVTLRDVTFKGSNLRNTIFRDTFGMVLDVDFSPDGQFLAAATADRSITLWRLHEYQPYLVIDQSLGYSHSIAFSPDSKILASGGISSTIQLWDISSGKHLGHVSSHSSDVTAVVFSPDGKTLYSSSEDQTIAVWDVGSGQLLRQTPTADNLILALAASPDGRLLAGGGYNGAIYLWETKSGKLIRRMMDGNAKIHSIAFSPDGAVLATAAEDNEVHLWHAHNGKKAGSLSGHTNIVLSVAFHPDGATLASSSADRTVRLWNYRQRRIVRLIHGSANWVTCVAFSPDGNILASGGYERKIHLWQSRNGRLLHALHGLLKMVNAVVFSPDGNLLAGAYYDRPVRLWDMQDGGRLHSLLGHKGSIRQLVFNPDGRTLAVSGDEKKLRLWDAQTGELQRTLTVDKNFVRTLAFSPNGNLLAAGVGTGYGTLMVWEAATSKLRFTVPDIRTGLEFHFCFSPDGRFLAYSDRDHALKLMNVDDGAVCCSLTNHKSPVEVIRFSADGTLMASLDRDGTLFVWQVTVDGSVTVRSHYQGSSSNADFWNLVFSPNSKLIAFQLDGDKVGIFDTHRGQLRCSMDESLYGAGNLEFSRDSTFLITGSIDGNINMWNAKTGEHYRALVGHAGMVMSMDTDRTGPRVASGDDNGLIRVWDIHAGKCDLVLTQPGPYEGLDISNAEGLSPAQIVTLKALGAVA